MSNPVVFAKSQKPITPVTVPMVIEQRRSRILVWRGLRKLALRLLLTALLVWLVFSQVFGMFRVSGEGMYPRLRDGDLVITYRLGQELQVGGVVAYQVEGKRYFGRLVALGGDVVDVTEDGLITRNGNLQQEEVFFPTLVEGKRIRFPIALHPFEVFILGDNRDQVLDSRDFGAIDKDNLEGTVIAVLRRRGI